jgi:glycerophosphoryl diester phosphodiesterase
MRATSLLLASVLLCVVVSHAAEAPPRNIQVGPRPYFLVDDMRPGPLKTRLDSEQCRERPFRATAFSIGHRGAPLQFPEHTRESYLAAARMGAGILECDVTFTKDKELVCRHAQNDLHTTTNILLRPELAAKCTRPFTPASFDAEGKLLAPASAECRSSDITLAEFKTLRGKMDAFNPAARTEEEYTGGTAAWRTDLYAGPSSGTLMTHAESIALFTQLGVKMMPELKAPVVPMPFEGFSREDYARKLIEEYRRAGVKPAEVFPQSFSLEAILFWIHSYPDYGRQAVHIEDAKLPADLPTRADLDALAAKGVRIWAPPMWALLASANGELVPSQTARDAKAAGLTLIPWALERSGVLAGSTGGPFHQSVADVVHARGNEGITMEVLDVLGREIGVKGVFSDWPGTVTYYANCVGLL